MQGAFQHGPPVARPFTSSTGGRSPAWQSGVPRSLATGRVTLPICQAAHQHTHMEEVIEDMTKSVQNRSSNHTHSRTQHIFRSTRVPSPALLRTPATQQQVIIPHLDGQTTDPTDVLTWLRDHMLSTQARMSAIITAEETGPSLLDLAMVLILLDEDIRREEQGAVVLFQPLLDMRGKMRLDSNHRTHWTHNDPYNHHHDSNHHNHHNDAGYGPAPVGALVSKARCPRLLLEQPSSCIAATLRMDCSDVAGIVADAVEDHSSTRLRVANSPDGLVAAWRAVRRARAVVRARSGGARDIVCTAQVESLSSAAARAPVAPPAQHTGNRNAHAVGAAAQQQQQGILYMNVWRIR